MYNFNYKCCPWFSPDYNKATQESKFNITWQQAVCLFVSPLSEIHKRRKMAMQATKGTNVGEA